MPTPEEIAEAVASYDETGKRDVPRMTEEQITETAMALAQGRIFCASQLPQGANLLPSVFISIALGGLGDYNLNQVGEIYQYLDKANEMSVNGFPTFMTAKVAHEDDWKVVIKRAIKAHDAMVAAAEGGT